MKIFVSDEAFPKRKIIDSDTFENIDKNDKVQYIFSDEKVCLKILKMLYNKNLDSYFIVKNFENFLYVARAFRNITIEVVTNLTKKYVTGINVLYDNQLNSDTNIIKSKKAIKKSLSNKSIESTQKDLKMTNKEHQFICSTESFRKSKDLQVMIEEYVKLEKALKKKSLEDNNDKTQLYGYAVCKTEFEKGVRLSFFPKIFDSIRSSLANSKTYKSKPQLCHSIYQSLKTGKNTLKDIENLSENKENVYNTVKSMIFAGIIIKKGDTLVLNDILV